MFLRRSLLVALSVSAVLVTGCSSGGSTAPAAGSLPDATSLLKDSAATTGKINSTHFTLKVNGSVPGISVQSIEGDVTKDGGGAAKGSGTLTLMGQLVDAEFVLAKGSLYVKGPTGGWQQIPSALSSSLYDPSAILDPQRGIAKVLAGVTDAKTEAAEDVNGTPAYRVTGKVTKDALSGLLPGLPIDANITAWLRQDAGHAPVKATLTFLGGATVDVVLSNVDTPVTVTPPA